MIPRAKCIDKGSIKKANTRHGRWLRKTACFKAQETVLHLWFLSVWLLRSAECKLGLTMAVGDLRPPIGIVCQSQSCWQVKVFACWPVAAGCWNSLRLVSGAERRPLWDNDIMATMPENKTRLSALRSYRTPIYAFCHVPEHFEETKPKKKNP